MLWLIDGMNVIGTRPDGWWKDRPGAMSRLVRSLEQWALASCERATVIFEQPPRPPISSAVIEIAYAPRARRDSADSEIERRLAHDPNPSAIRVVTSDVRLAGVVRAFGASVEPAAKFRALIEDR